MKDYPSTDKDHPKDYATNREGTEPPEGDFEIGRYKHIIYTINREGIVKGEKERTITPQLKGGKYYVCIRQIDGKDRNRITISVLELMSKAFGEYFTGYHKKKQNPDQYELKPIDGDYTNINYKNLEYRDKIEGTKLGTILSLQGQESINEIAKRINLSPDYIKRVLRENSKEYQNFKKEYKINCSFKCFPTYLLLIKSNGKITNAELEKLTGCSIDSIIGTRSELKRKGIIG